MSSVAGRPQLMHRHIPLMTRFFMQLVKEKKPNGCWNWTGCGRRRPLIVANGKQVYAHRFSYERFVGPIPEGLIVCHRCDNPRCVRPDHLFVGTQNDNMKDMKAKGRANRPIGAENGNSKLTESDVRLIRNLYIPRHPEFGQKALAERFGVKCHAIYDVVSGRKWGHL